MPVDFYLEEFNLVIEYQGVHHYKCVYYSKKNRKKYRKLFNDGVKRDILKKRLCKQHGVNIEYIKYNEDCIDQLKNILLKYGTTS